MEHEPLQVQLLKKKIARLEREREIESQFQDERFDRLRNEYRGKPDVRIELASVKGKLRDAEEEIRLVRNYFPPKFAISFISIAFVIGLAIGYIARGAKYVPVN